MIPHPLRPLWILSGPVSLEAGSGRLASMRRTAHGVTQMNTFNTQICETYIVAWVTVQPDGNPVVFHFDVVAMR